jgi:hypothetical protein
MRSSTTRIITIASAILALAAPAAGAAPMRDGSPAIAAPQRANVYVPPAESPAPHRANVYVPPAVSPAPAAPPAHSRAVAADNGTSLLVYLLPSLALVALLCGTALFVRSQRQPLRA